MIEIDIDKINSFIPSEVKAFIRKLNRSDYEVYLTGSCVRNIVLQSLGYPNVPQTEIWEISTNATIEQFEKYIPPHTYNYYAAKCHVQMFTLKSSNNDMIFCKIRTYRTNDNWKMCRAVDDSGYLPNLTDNLIEDLSHRDFAINAMAYNPNKDIGLIDSFGGLIDIENRMIRCINNPYNCFAESNIRILRAIRIAYQLGFGIEQGTSNAIKQKAYLFYNNNTSLVEIEQELAELVQITKNTNDDKKIIALEDIVRNYSEVFTTILLKEIIEK